MLPAAAGACIQEGKAHCSHQLAPLSGSKRLKSAIFETLDHAQMSRVLAAAHHHSASWQLWSIVPSSMRTDDAVVEDIVKWCCICRRGSEWHLICSTSCSSQGARLTASPSCQCIGCNRLPLHREASGLSCVCSCASNVHSASQCLTCSSACNGCQKNAAYLHSSLTCLVKKTLSQRRCNSSNTLPAAEVRVGG